MRSLHDLHLGGIRRQHPQRNLQTPPRWIDDRDRTVSALRSADDRQVAVVKWVEWVEDPDVRGFCAQGTVRVGGIILISTALSPAAESRPMAAAGSPAAPGFSFRCACCRGCSAGYFWKISIRLSTLASCSSSTRWRYCEILRNSLVTWRRSGKRNGSFTPSRSLPDLSRCSTRWAAIRIL